MSRSTRAVVFGVTQVLLVVCAQLTASPHVGAQWLPDRAYTEGPGFRVGDVELHPGVALRGGYDTNVFRTPGTRAHPERDSPILAVTGHFNVSTLSRQRLSQGEAAAGASAAPLPAPITFNLGTAVTYFHYFRDKAPKNLEVDVDGVVNILPSRPFGLDIGASYARLTRPFTVQVAGGGNQAYAHDRIAPKLILRGQSRSGVLQGTIGFAPTITLYESKVFQSLDLYQYDVPATLGWRFLPNTALVYDARFGLNDYAHNPSANDRRATVFLSDGQRFQNRLGINGAITPNLAIRALAGYAVAFFDRAVLDDHEDAVGELALTYAWSQKSNVEAGYQRTMDVSYLGGWTQADRGYVKSSMLFGGAFALGLEAGVAHVNYGRLFAPDGTPLGEGGRTHRTDIRVDGGVHAEYRATNWLAIMADFSTLVTRTDFVYATAPNIPVYPGQFKTFQVFGGVRAHY